MIKKITLFFFMGLFLFFTLTAINAGDVNTTDFNKTLEINDINEKLSADINKTSLTEPVKNQTEIKEKTATIYYKGSYSVILKDSNTSNPIANKKINFIINNLNYSSTSDSEGVVSVNLSLNPGTYTASAYFAGDDEYLSSNLTLKMQILPTVKAYDMTKYYKGATQYTAVFYNSNGNALANRNVVITINGKSYTKSTNTNGAVSIPIKFKPGTYKITSTDPITGYQITTNFKILSTISSSNLKKVKGDGKKFVVKFFKSNGKPLAKKRVKIKIKGKYRKFKTNKKGKVVISLKKFKKGTYKVVIRNRDGLSKTNKIKIYKIAKTKLKTTFYTFLSNDTKTVKVKLTTSLGAKSNSHKLIKIKINGKTYYKKTDSNGVVSINAPSKKGLYTVKYSYKGNKFFKSSKATNFVTVLNSTESKLTVKSTTSFGYGAGTLFKVAFTADGVPLAKRTMTFTIDGKQYTKTTDNKGIASIPITQKIGTYTVVYKTYDKFKVKGTSNSSSIEVFKRAPSKLTWHCGSSYKDSSQSFKIRLTNSGGNAVSAQSIELKIDGITYKTKTNSGGYAKIKTSVALGKYKVSVKFRGSNDYLSSQTSKSVKVKLSKFGKGINERAASYLRAYLKSSSHCPVKNKHIKSLVKSLTKGLKSKVDKAKAIFNFVRDSIKYRYYYNTGHGAVGTLKAKSGNCVDQAHLLVSMYRTAGLKARYIHGRCTFSDGRFGHVWTQVLIGKHWVCGDPTNQRNALGKIASWNTHTYKLQGKHQSLPF